MVLQGTGLIGIEWRHARPQRERLGVALAAELQELLQAGDQAAHVTVGILRRLRGSAKLD